MHGPHGPIATVSHGDARRRGDLEGPVGQLSLNWGRDYVVTRLLAGSEPGYSHEQERSVVEGGATHYKDLVRTRVCVNWR